MSDVTINKGKRERDPIRTKTKIKNAVGEILKKQGYTGLSASNIAKMAGLSQRLVSYYYSNIDNLIEEYLSEKDYWLTFAKMLETSLIKEDPSGLEDLLYAILVGHYECFEKDEEMRKLITWEISEYNQLLRKDAETRERFGEIIFQKMKPFFEDTDINIRGEMAIMTAGIYYLILHANANGSTFCGIQIKTEEGKSIIFNAIRRIISLSFALAEKVRRNKNQN